MKLDPKIKRIEHQANWMEAEMEMIDFKLQAINQPLEVMTMTAVNFLYLEGMQHYMM